jgi:hypothetical protein
MTKLEVNADAGERCKNCGSTVFLVDETCTHVEITGEIVKTHPGDLCNRNCVRCTYPDLYPNYAEWDETALIDEARRNGPGRRGHRDERRGTLTEVRP